MKKILITAIITFIITSVGWMFCSVTTKATQKMYDHGCKTTVRMALIQIVEDFDSGKEEMGRKKLDLLLEEWREFEREPGYKKGNLAGIISQFEELENTTEKKDAIKAD